MNDAAKKTPLFATHLKQGGRLIEFHGWQMPVHYSGIIAEHQAVRTAAGLFDISHMGQVQAQGQGAEALLNRLFTNDVRRLQPGQGQYTLMCHEGGGVIDDLYVFRLAAEQYWLVINASRAEADWAWMTRQLNQLVPPGEAQLENLSGRCGAVAVQGPRAADCVQAALDHSEHGSGRPVRDLRKNQIAQFLLGNAPVWISRTGYTGEDGCEIMGPAEAMPAVWETLMAAGHDRGLIPAGLGARDTLRTEAGYPLYGHELTEDISPLEAGLERFVVFDKPPFIGQEALLCQRTRGVTKRCIAFTLQERCAPPRPHYALWSREPTPRPIGEVTSGTQSPSLGLGLGMGYVPPDYAHPGQSIAVDIRGRRAAATVVARPIYRQPLIVPNR